MELQKKKETAWVIKKKDNKGYFNFKYIEEEGLITGVGIGLKDLKNEVFFEMTPLGHNQMLRESRGNFQQDMCVQWPLHILVLS